jgi:hypothetical protein
MRAQQQYFSYDPGFKAKEVLSVTLASVLSTYGPKKSIGTASRARVAATG